MSDVNLNLLFERCIHAMRGCADGATMNYSKSEEGSSTTGDGAPAPYSPLWADELHYRREYRRAHTVEEKRAVIHLVVRAIRASSVGNSKMADHTSGTKEWRQEIAHDPRRAVTVADAWNVSKQTVYDFRKKYGEAA